MDQQQPMNQFYILTQPGHGAPQAVPVQFIPQPASGEPRGVVGIAGMRRMELNQMGPQLQQQKPKGVFGILKEAIINLVTEEVEPSDDSAQFIDESGQMPIGLSQLTRKTFQASNQYPSGGQVMFRPSRPIHDYSFNNLVNEPPPPPEPVYAEPLHEALYEDEQMAYASNQPVQPFRQYFRR